MKKTNNNILARELEQAGMTPDQIQAFIADMSFADSQLGENPVKVPAGLSQRIIAAVGAAEVRPMVHQRNWFLAHLRMYSATAAMLLVVLSLVFYYSAQNGTTTGGQPDGKILATSDNPFDHPSLLMDMLMERNSTDSMDAITLEAVSEFWSQDESDIEPSSLNDGDYARELVMLIVPNRQA